MSRVGKNTTCLNFLWGGLLFKCKFVFGLICKYTLLLTVRCEERRTVKDPCDPKKDRAPAVVIPLTLNRPEIGRLNFFPVYICQHTMRQGNNERGSCLKLIYFISYFFTQISHRLFFSFFFLPLWVSWIFFPSINIEQCKSAWRGCHGEPGVAAERWCRVVRVDVGAGCGRGARCQQCQVQLPVA